MTHPTADADRGVSLAKDVELVRATILYADHVELVSLSAVMLAAVLQLAGGDETQLLELLGSLDDGTIAALGGNLPEGWREYLPLLPSLAKTPVLDLVGLGDERKQLADGLNEAMEQLKQSAEEMLEKSGGAELLTGFQAGVLSLSHSGFASEDSDVDGTIARWVGLLKDLLRDGRTRLVFDDDVAALIRSMIEEGLVEPDALSLKHASEAAVGSGLIARLPAFPQAPLDELLDLRSDLGDPLVRYRRAVMRLASKLRSRAFDVEAAVELDDLWHEEVAPVLVELEERFADHGLVREIARQLGEDLKSLIREGAALYVGLDRLTTVDAWISATAAAAAPVAAAAAKGAAASHVVRRQLEEHDLFYLYSLQRGIGG